MYSVYILKSAKGNLYIGITNNLNQRIRAHNGEITGGAKYTRRERPYTLVYEEQCNSREAALRREYILKQLSRKEKEKIVASVSTLE